MKKKPSQRKQSKSTSTTSLSDDAVSPNWEQFNQRWSAHPALEADTIYALPKGLIGQIQKKTELFSDEELDFEISLTKFGGGGFFLKQPFGYFGLSQRPRTDVEKTQEDAASKAVQGIHSMLADDYKERGLSKKQIENRLKEDAKVDAKIDERREGFAGWLLTNAKFVHQRDRLIAKWRETLTVKPQYLSFPRSYWGEQPEIPLSDREMFSDVVTFLRLWNLEGMTTWDLPLPMYPGWQRPGFYAGPQLGNAGLQVFLPWYLLRHRDFLLNDLSRQIQPFSAPLNLKTWIEVQDKKWGEKRFAVILRLFVWIELALKRRYSDRLQMLTTKIDHAISDYLDKRGASSDRNMESIRKARQKMTRLLKR